MSLVVKPRFPAYHFLFTRCCTHILNELLFIALLLIATVVDTPTVVGSSSLKAPMNVHGHLVGLDFHGTR